MANKTLIPALSAKVGDWTYYICVMKYAQVAREVRFAYELGGNKDLNTLIQRGISARTGEIVDYLKNSSHRFLNSIIVAAWGGNPNFTKVHMQDDEGLLEDLDSQFGILTFDGSQQYFALDGQHRLRAIKDVLGERPELGAEEICVLFVSHLETEEGKRRTRRLFTNLNRNAKSTTKAENIALDEDDAFAILVRRLATDHEFLKNRLLIINKAGEDGQLSLAGGSVPVGHKTAFSTLATLYELTKELSFGLDASLTNKTVRPSDSVIEDTYEAISARLHELLTACGDVRNKLEKVADAKELRAPKGNEAVGHPMMRPIIQMAIARAASQLVESDTLTWKEVLARLKKLEWKLAAPPWLAVVSVDGNSAKMLTQRENVELLDNLLLAHLAPPSKKHIERARREFRRLRGKEYSVKEEDLSQLIIKESDLDGE